MRITESNGAYSCSHEINRFLSVSAAVPKREVGKDADGLENIDDFWDAIDEEGAEKTEPRRPGFFPSHSSTFFELHLLCRTERQEIVINEEIVTCSASLPSKYSA